MRCYLAAAVLLCSLPLALHSEDTSTDLVTNSGATYKAARVQSVDADGITYFHSTGVTKIAFADLPSAVQKKYGYDAALQPTIVALSRPTVAAPPVNVIEEPTDRFLGASVTGYSREAVLYRLADGSIVGRKMEDVDADTRERITKLLDAEDELKKKIAAENAAYSSPLVTSNKPNALYNSGKDNSSRNSSGNSGRGSGRRRR